MVDVGTIWAFNGKWDTVQKARAWEYSGEGYSMGIQKGTLWGTVEEGTTEYGVLYQAEMFMSRVLATLSCTTGCIRYNQKLPYAYEMLTVLSHWSKHNDCS